MLVITNYCRTNHKYHSSHSDNNTQMRIQKCKMLFFLNIMNSDVKAKIQLLATFVIFFDIFDLESNNHKRVNGKIYTVLGTFLKID